MAIVLAHGALVHSLAAGCHCVYDSAQQLPRTARTLGMRGLPGYGVSRAVPQLSKARFDSRQQCRQGRTWNHSSLMRKSARKCWPCDRQPDGKTISNCSRDPILAATFIKKQARTTQLLEQCTLRARRAGSIPSMPYSGPPKLASMAPPPNVECEARLRSNFTIMEELGGARRLREDRKDCWLGTEQQPNRMYSAGFATSLHATHHALNEEDYDCKRYRALHCVGIQLRHVC